MTRLGGTPPEAAPAGEEEAPPNTVLVSAGTSMISALSNFDLPPQFLHGQVRYPAITEDLEDNGAEIEVGAGVPIPAEAPQLGGAEESPQQDDEILLVLKDPQTEQWISKGYSGGVDASIAKDKEKDNTKDSKNASLVPTSQAARDQALLVDQKVQLNAMGAGTVAAIPNQKVAAGKDPQGETQGDSNMQVTALRVDTAMAKVAREIPTTPVDQNHPSLRYALDENGSVALPGSIAGTASVAEARVPLTSLSRGVRENGEALLHQPGAVAMGTDVGLPTRDEEAASIAANSTGNGGQEYTPVEALLNATLVDLEGEDPEVIEAKPALEGFQALIHNSRFRVVMVLVIIVILAIAVPLLVISQRSNETTVFVPTENNETNLFLECGSYFNQQADYRGTINVTLSGKPCLRWDAQNITRTNPWTTPHLGLDENYCRTGDVGTSGGRAPFCYVDYGAGDDLEGILEYCDVPYCEDFSQNLTCGTAEFGQSDYLGTINTTINGRTCQAWSETTPHHHNQQHNSLSGNYCRNPDGEPRAWCYTTDPLMRWEYCNIPFCDDPFEEAEPSEQVSSGQCYNCTTQECGSERVRYADYRGTVNVTNGGRTCQRWDVHEPHAHHHKTNVTYPGAGLEGNYCRNPDGEAGAWCYTTDPEKKWERCSVPTCVAPHSTVCGSSDTKQRDYRGTVNVTESGLVCQRWERIRPHSHFNHPVLQPEEGLEENYCRNPPPKYKKDLGEFPIEGARAWCYTEDRLKVWEYCTVPFCDAAEAPTESKSCGSKADNQATYRGTQSVTKSGLTCQRWDQQAPHTHSNTPDAKPFAGLEGNYCRNPDGEPSVWCYTTDPEKRWDFCDVPFCEDIQTPLIPRTGCGTLSERQEDYRGSLAVSRSGNSCLAWSNQSFHFHGYTPDNYPKAGLEDNNFCRNPDSSLVPWCFVADSELGIARKEPCAVPVCEDEEKLRNCGALDNKQIEYRGFLNQSSTGLACQPWDMGESSQVTPATHPLGGLEENYCRNPDGQQDRAWCYTEAGREVCNVPDCATEIHVSCGSTMKNQRDYRGALNTTVSGKVCQSWGSQQPHQHRFSPYSYLEEGLDGSSCRNPNGVDERAWCYTEDPDTLWEYCDVPWC